MYCPEYCIIVPYPKLRRDENTVLVSHTPNLAELRTLSNIEHGAQPQVHYYQCSQIYTTLYYSRSTSLSVLSYIGNIDKCYLSINGQAVV